MKCKLITDTIASIVLILVFAVVTFRCDESLPTYVAPKNVMSFKIEQIDELPLRLAPPGHQLVHFQLTGQNTFDEVFEDSVDIKGSLRVFWIDNPDYYKTFVLNVNNINEKNLISNGRMTLLPGQKFTMDLYWDLITDGGVDLLTKLDFVRLVSRQCSPNVACSDPEYFMAETSLNVFDRLGYINADSKIFPFVGYVCIVCGSPPCSLPVGGCN